MKQNIFYSFTGQDGNKIDVLKATVGVVLGSQMDAVKNPEIESEYGGGIFVMRRILMIDGQRPSFDQILMLGLSDNQNIDNAINAQMEGGQSIIELFK